MNPLRCPVCGRAVGRVEHSCPAPRSLWDRLWEKVDASGDCWLWTGAKNGWGYGQLVYQVGHPRQLKAHRAAWELLVGPIPDGLEIDHRCRTPLCVNPDHLEVVTRAENNRRSYSVSGKAARQTHCNQGHAFTPENTYRWRNRRYCVACRAVQRAYRTRGTKQLALFEDKAA